MSLGNILGKPIMVPIENLLLDPQNPRLNRNAQGKNQTELLHVLYENFDITDLADSLSQNGYFAEEPLVVVPKNLPKKLENPTTAELKNQFKEFVQQKNTKFYTVEGNRRLATCKLLMNPEDRGQLKIKSFGPEHLADEVAASLKKLPAIVYPNRNAVLIYLGVRHIIGVEKWDSYPKARYIAGMVESGATLDDIQAKIGDRKNATKLSYICYKILEQAKDLLGYDTTKAENKFSFLLLSVGGSRNFLGMPRKISDVNYNEPVPKDKKENLHFLLTCLYGDKGRAPLIEESRDITDYLKWVLDSDEAYAYLKETGNLKEAYEYTAGEETYLYKALATVNKKLDLVLGKVHRHRDKPNIREGIEKASQTIEELLKRMND